MKSIGFRIICITLNCDLFEVIVGAFRFHYFLPNHIEISLNI